MTLRHRGLGLAIGMAADQVFADPQKHHPVAWFGSWATRVEETTHADNHAAGTMFAALAVAPVLVGGLLVERVGLNLVDARIPDNAGVQPVDEPVVPGGPAAYLVSLPVKAMLAGIREAQVPAELSLSAGTYVCNALLYQVLHQAHQLPPDQRPRCGFIHLPPAATVSLDRQERGLRAALARVDSAEPGLPGGFLG